MQYEFSTNLFGLPYYVGKIDKQSFNREQVVNDITHNYQVSPNRDEWDTSSIKMSNLHHSYSDYDNPNFRRIDYSQLIPLYNKHIENFFNLYMPARIKYNFSIQNYTCMSKGQHMREHDHEGSEFSAVHYLKFSEEHTPTAYTNPLNFADYFPRIMSKKMVEATKDSRINYSWTKLFYKFDVKEDDFIIWPALLKHFVPISNSDELRMVIVINISILDDE